MTGAVAGKGKAMDQDPVRCQKFERFRRNCRASTKRIFNEALGGWPPTPSSVASPMTPTEKLEPSGVSFLEKRLRVVDEGSSRKQPRIYKQPRSKVLEDVGKFLPRMEEADRILKERLKTDLLSKNVDMEKVPESREGHVEMVLDCGVFEILNTGRDELAEDGEKLRVLKEELDAQLEALSEEDLLKLFWATRPERTASGESGSETSAETSRAAAGTSSERRTAAESESSSEDAEV